MLDMSSLTWQTRAPYPYAKIIWDNPSLHYNGVFIVFGGEIVKPGDVFDLTGQIASYNPINDKWTSLGQMKTPRKRHAIIATTDYILIVGGQMKLNNHSSERCVLSSNSITCTRQPPSFQYSSTHGFAIEENYCY